MWTWTPADSSTAFSTVASRGPTRKNRAVILAGQYYPRFTSRKAEAKGLFSCDSFRMDREPVADVEIQHLAEPWSCVVSPRPPKLAGLHDVAAGDAFLVSDVLLAHVCCLFGQRAKVRLCVGRGDGGLLIFGSDLVLPENAVTEKRAPFLGS